MRRTASEVLHDLEMRVARLEGRGMSRGMSRRSSWDEPAEYNHPMMQVVRRLKGKSIGKWDLDVSYSGASMWTDGMASKWDDMGDNIYITYDGRRTTYIFSKEDEYGKPQVVGEVDVGRGGNDPEADFLKASAKVLRGL